ncbi:MAG: hypothetical protein AB7I68_14065 [Porticoccaceae bacterium]
MTGRVRAWLDGGAALRWLSFHDYARHVFGGDHPDWFREPMRQVAGLADANKVLRSQVIEFDLGALWAAHAALAAAAEGAARLAAVLESPAVAGYCDTAIAALVHQQAGRADVWLALPSPGGALVALGTPADAIDFDMLDDAAGLIADFLRTKAAAGIDGVVMTLAATGIAAADEIDAVAPIRSSAAHYDWLFALRVVNAAQAEAWAEVGPDLWLPADTGATLPPAAPACTGLERAFWQGGPPPAAGVALYGTVPADLDPASIAQRVGSLP